jgi:uncharacterized membrane protein YhhN
MSIPLSLWPLPFLIITVGLLLRFETRQPRDVAQVRVWKPLSTLIVIAICALSFTRPPGSFQPTYTVLMLTGLALSLIGDVLLIDGDNPRFFVRGLFAFLFANIFYILAFFYAQSLSGRPPGLNRILPMAALLLLLGIVVYFYLRSNLGSLRQPVMLYMTVISLMVLTATSAVNLTTTPLLSQTALAAGGAVLFYVSDLILALNKFVFDDEGRYNSVWILGLYYWAQALLALSASFLR